MLRLIPRPSRIVFVIHGSLAFRLLCWGKNGFSLTGTESRRHSTQIIPLHYPYIKQVRTFVCQEHLSYAWLALHSFAGLCGM